MDHHPYALRLTPTATLEDLDVSDHVRAPFGVAIDRGEQGEALLEGCGYVRCRFSMKLSCTHAYLTVKCQRGAPQLPPRAASPVRLTRCRTEAVRERTGRDATLPSSSNETMPFSELCAALDTGPLLTVGEQLGVTTSRLVQAATLAPYRSGDVIERAAILAEGADFRVTQARCGRGSRLPATREAGL